MFDRILIPTDGSDGAERGVEHGLGLAEKYDATVHTLFVVDERAVPDTLTDESGTQFLERHRARGDTALEAVAADATDAGLDVVTAHATGVPHKEIVRYARANDIDLIVMGRHGETEHERPTLGSCTDRVIRLSPVPVLPV